jgi:uncharacterized phiE125 gp8 family phage protein
MKVTRISPEIGAVSIDDARKQLRIDPDDTSQDVIILELVQTATSEVEKFTGLQLMQADYTIFARSFSKRLAVPVYPLLGITSIAYYNEAGDLITLDPSNYMVEIINGEGVIRFSNVDEIVLNQDRAYPLTINAKVGHGAIGANTAQQYAAIPTLARRSIMAKITSWYDKREDYYTPGQMKASDILLVPLCRNWPS